MSIKRKPTSPGEILSEEFLKPLGITQKQLADHIGSDIKVINRIINRRTSLTAETALKLASAFKTSPDFWLNAQKATDIYEAAKRLKKLPGALVVKAHPKFLAPWVSSHRAASGRNQ